MKLLILNEDPVVGASWINPKKDNICRFYQGLNSYKLFGFTHNRFLARSLLTKIDSIIIISSGWKIRFQKNQEYFGIVPTFLPKGLNEF